MSNALGLEGLELTTVDTGGMLIGSWFIGITYGILMVELILYLRSRAQDPVLLKLLVGFLFSTDTTMTILFLASTYRQLVKVSPGSMDMYIPPLLFVCIPFLTPGVLALVNSFLIWRYHRLTKRNWLCYGLYFLALFTWAIHLWVATLNIKLRHFNAANIQSYIDDFKLAANLAKGGLIIEVLMVSFIWALLIITLVQYLRQELLGARRVVLRLIFITLESGTIATAMCVASLVFYLTSPASSSLIVLTALTSRVYFMGMMFTLVMRGSGSSIMRDGSSVTREPGSFGASNSVQLSHIRTNNSQYQHKVIRVSQNMATEVDDELEKGPTPYQASHEESEAFEYGRTSKVAQSVKHADA